MGIVKYFVFWIYFHISFHGVLYVLLGLLRRWSVYNRFHTDFNFDFQCLAKLSVQSSLDSLQESSIKTKCIVYHFFTLKCLKDLLLIL